MWKKREKNGGSQVNVPAERDEECKSVFNEMIYERCVPFIDEINRPYSYYGDINHSVYLVKNFSSSRLTLILR